ncbi:hypothetical protein E2C01_015953 [Portunus trituberculatus]|uniref:Uncharacterized protein n=1 Tax=Portunus trituberculatus TaxID=210409 RepID=A0A5B7DPG4_PORTR|nr:hypothetical protein [Portunus trituberculatus]
MQFRRDAVSCRQKSNGSFSTSFVFFCFYRQKITLIGKQQIVDRLHRVLKVIGIAKVEVEQWCQQQRHHHWEHDSVVS